MNDFHRLRELPDGWLGDRLLARQRSQPGRQGALRGQPTGPLPRLSHQGGERSRRQGTDENQLRVRVRHDGPQSPVGRDSGRRRLNPLEPCYPSGLETIEASACLPGDVSLKNLFRGRTTAKMSLADRFHRNPLEFLDREFPASGGMVQTGPEEFSLGDPIAARSVLLNQGKLYLEDSDFFTTRLGLFGPREAQLNIRRESRALFENFLNGRGQEALISLVKANVAGVSEWPDTGNRLVYRYLQPLLLAPDSPPKLLRLLDDIVEHAVLRGPCRRQSVWRRRILQFRMTLLLSGAIQARRAQRGFQPYDLLGVLARARGGGRHRSRIPGVVFVLAFF